MSTDHNVPANNVEESTTTGISQTAEFILLMVITSVTALGGVAVLVI